MPRFPWRPGTRDERRRVLVAAADGNVALLASQLEDADYAVEIAESGEAALACAERDPPALICLDVALPGEVDDWDALALLKESPRERSAFRSSSALRTPTGVRRRRSAQPTSSASRSIPRSCATPWRGCSRRASPAFSSSTTSLRSAASSRRHCPSTRCVRRPTEKRRCASGGQARRRAADRTERRVARRPPLPLSRIARARPHRRRRARTPARGGASPPAGLRRRPVQPTSEGVTPLQAT